MSLAVPTTNTRASVARRSTTIKPSDIEMTPTSDTYMTEVMARDLKTKNKLDVVVEGVNAVANNADETFLTQRGGKIIQKSTLTKAEVFFDI